MKYIIITILITTSTYALAENKRPTYRILFNKNTKEIRILERTNPTKECEKQLKNDKWALKLIEKEAKKSKETLVYSKFYCMD